MNAKDIKRDHERLLENLRLIQTNFTAAALAEALGISRATWTNRMREPWRQFSYDDFKSIARFCKIDFVQLVDGHLSIK